MAELPYYYEDEGRGWKKYAESLIPIVIIAIIIIVIVGKTTGIFCGLPVVGSTLCGGSKIINIAVIGDLNSINTIVGATNLEKFIESDTGRACKMQFTPYQPEDLTYIAGQQLKKNYDLVILAGEREYKRPIRDAVTSYLSAGGNLIVIGDAATKDPEDAVYSGWGHIEVPFNLRPTNQDTVIDGIPTLTLRNAVLKVTDLNHPIVVGYGFKINMSAIDKTSLGCGSDGSPVKLIDVAPDDANSLMIISGEDESGENRAVPAVINKKSMLGGNVYYFAFDPGCIPNMWISTVSEITGTTCV